MIYSQYISILLTFLVLAILIPIIGRYIADVYQEKTTILDVLFYPVEAWIYKLIGTDSKKSMDWKEYTVALVLTNITFGIFAFLILTQQGGLPLNYFNSPDMSFRLAFHTSASYLTNTDFQHFNPVTQISMFSEMFAIMLLMFVSSATGLVVAVSLIRGIKNSNGKIGNFYIDFVRSITRILLPFSILTTFLLVFMGVPDTLTPYIILHPVTGGSSIMPLGLNAAHTSIELLGTNGGSYINGGSSNPLSDPSNATIFLETLMMLLFPFSLIFAYGEMIKKKSESFVLFIVTFGLLLFAVLSVVNIEMQGNVMLSTIPHLSMSSGNFVGKDTRFGVVYGSFAQTVSVYTNTGAQFVNIDTMLPGSQIFLLFGMFIQAVPGGIGTGFTYLLLYLLLSVFLGGLMVGRTPEYIGKKIGVKEIKYTSLALIVHPILIITPFVIALLFNPFGSVTYSPHNLTELLYEFTSEAANNGSSMTLNDNNAFYNIAGGIIMLLSRFIPIVATLAIAGSLSNKKSLPERGGSMRTDSITFALYLIGVIIILGVLMFLPVIVIGPLRDYLRLSHYG